MKTGIAFSLQGAPHHLEQPEKWTKILSLEMTIFGLKMMVKSGLEKIILKFHVPSPFRIAAAQCRKICP